METIPALLNFFENFTTKKLFVIIFVVCLSVAAISAFEAYTSYFTFQKAERQAELLNKLVSIREGSSLTPAEEDIRSRLLDRIAVPEIDSKQSLTWGVRISWDKFLYGMIPWTLFILVTLFSKSEPQKWNAILGMGVFAVIFALIATLSPFDSIWAKIFYVPFGLFFCFLIFIGAFVFDASRRAKNLQQANKKETLN